MDAAMVPGTAAPRPACTTGDEGAHREHHMVKGKEADPFWGLTAPGAVGNGGSPRLRWRKREEAPCGTGELECSCCNGSGGQPERSTRAVDWRRLWLPAGSCGWHPRYAWTGSGTTVTQRAWLEDSATSPVLASGVQCGKKRRGQAIGCGELTTVAMTLRQGSRSERHLYGTGAAPWQPSGGWHNAWCQVETAL
jgi:hypothetical protein